jgi:hypothetical protein
LDDFSIVNLNNATVDDMNEFAELVEQDGWAILGIEVYPNEVVLYMTEWIIEDNIEPMGNLQR